MGLTPKQIADLLQPNLIRLEEIEEANNRVRELTILLDLAKYKRNRMMVDGTRIGISQAQLSRTLEVSRQRIREIVRDFVFDQDKEQAVALEDYNRAIHEELDKQSK